MPRSARCCSDARASRPRRPCSSVRVWSGPEATRVVFELSGPVEHRVFTLADPDRVVIDLPARPLQRGSMLAEPKGAVTALRTGARPAASCASCSSSTQRAKPKTFLLAPNEQYGHRLVVDLPPARGAAPSCGVRRRLRPTSGRDVVVAIDAGHGGEDPGASGRSGAREKDVVLAIARKLATEVNAQPGMRAVLVAQRRLLRVAPQADGDRARRASRLLHLHPRRLVPRCECARARRSTCCRKRARATKRRCCSRSARTRPT